MDITVIILTKNEQKNISAAVTSAKKIASRIIVVDCGSTDSTVQIAKELGTDVYFHEWAGHAAQFNWALDNCDIKTEWVYRLDADERVTDELAEEIESSLSTDIDIDGYEFRWYIFFMNKRLKHGGTHSHYFLRLFRFGCGRCEDRLMDERIIVNGKVKRLTASFDHYDYKGLDAWLNKHVWYSNLEIEMHDSTSSDGNTMQKQRRNLYYSLPIFFRARLYFWYRYYFQLGFLDGKEGKVYVFLQSYWYRFLIDAKLYEKKKITR